MLVLYWCSICVRTFWYDIHISSFLVLLLIFYIQFYCLLFSPLYCYGKICLEWKFKYKTAADRFHALASIAFCYPSSTPGDRDPANVLSRDRPALDTWTLFLPRHFQLLASVTGYHPRIRVQQQVPEANRKSLNDITHGTTTLRLGQCTGIHHSTMIKYWQRYDKL